MRVATGRESEFTIMDDSLARRAMFDLIDAFYAQRIDGEAPPTRIRFALRQCRAGTWEALPDGQADLALGVTSQPGRCPCALRADGPGWTLSLRGAPPPAGCVAGAAVGGGLLPHRIVVVADTARQIEA